MEPASYQAPSGLHEERFALERYAKIGPDELRTAQASIADRTPSYLLMRQRGAFSDSKDISAGVTYRVDRTTSIADRLGIGTKLDYSPIGHSSMAIYDGKTPLNFMYSNNR
jgi:hypothetical protein